MTEHTATKLTILVVDDSRLMRLAARKILRDDFEILEAADGEQAWDTLQANPNVHLVMSDLSMPNLDGLGLLKRIRESDRENLKDMPVIIVTGAEDDDGSKQTALAAGASDFITKPFESVQLLARAKAQAKQQQTQQALHDSEASKQQLEQQAMVDTLTGLANAQEFASHVGAGLSYALRHRTELSLLLIQVDKYKVMFLRRGKQAAESVLQHLAQLLGEGRRREDAVARTGMDTFGIVLPSANCVGARRVAEQLLSAIRTLEVEANGEKLPFTVSIAVSTPDVSSDTTVEGMLQEASQKLRLAAAAGGDRIQGDLSQEDAVAPAPATTPATSPAPAAVAAPEIASVSEVQRALQALADGRRPDLDTAPLARAVLPLLQAWNRAHDHQHAALINALQEALGLDQQTPLRVPVDAR
jgi:diguanylate cyclase (GGDEF)-like protein